MIIFPHPIIRQASAKCNEEPFPCPIGNGASRIKTLLIIVAALKAAEKIV